MVYNLRMPPTLQFLNGFIDSYSFFCIKLFKIICNGILLSEIFDEKSVREHQFLIAKFNQLKIKFWLFETVILHFVTGKQYFLRDIVPVCTVGLVKPRKMA